MTAQPTVEDYLAQNADPDEDFDEETFTPLGLDPAMPSYTPPPSTDPLVMMAQSLQTIAETFSSQKREADQVQALREENADLANRLYWADAHIEAILAVCAKSKGQLAEKVRAVINPPVEPEAALGDPGPDGTVEEWRAFATAFGLEGTDQMNRSQIRTALGIAQPTES